MGAYLARRLATLPLLLLGISAISLALLNLNPSRGEINIRRGGKTGLGGAGWFCGASLKDGPTSPLDFLPAVDQLGEKSA